MSWATWSPELWLESLSDPFWLAWSEPPPDEPLCLELLWSEREDLPPLPEALLFNL
jgi:hypothetical protein